MGRASISIAITSNFNPKGVDAAIAKMEKLAVQATSLHGKYGKGLVDSGAQLGVAASQLAKLGKSIADIGDKLTMGVTVPMGIAAGASVLAATQIDTAWYNVRKTVDMTEEGYERLKQGAMDLAATQPVSAETILDIESLGGQLGITTGYLEDFARVVSGLDISTNLSSSQAATELAQFRNIVQMSEDELDNMASTIVDLGNHTATTESDMMDLAMRFASAGHIAGMSNSEILGMSAALSGLGMKAEAGGSAISRTINDINNSVAVGGENLQKWADLVGKTPEQFTEAWRAAPMEEFIEVLTHINEAGADMGAVLEELGITQIRQSDAMRRLASSGEYVTEVVERANQAWQQNSALTREVEKRNQSLESQFKTIGNRIVNTAAKFGEPIAEMTLEALDALEPLGNGIADVADSFAEADPTTQRFAFNLGMVAMAAGPVLSVTGRLMQGAGSLGTRIARTMQQYGNFTEALHTNDVAMINNLSELDTLATNFGISRNAAVKAAGGIDNFRLRAAAAAEVVKDEAESAEMGRIWTEAYTEALEKEGTTNAKAMNTATKAVQTQKNRNKITAAGQRAVENMTTAEMEAVLATDKGSASLEKQTKSVKTSSSALTSLKGVLMGIGGMAATAAITAGIVAFATECQRAAERAATLERATTGLRNATTNTAVQLNTLTESANGTALSAGALSQEIEAAIQSQANLADTINETNLQASVQIGGLSRAWQTIEKYANQSNLGASEQYQLQSAIDAVNAAGGEQWQVVDAANGKIADQNGVIQENTDAILDNIEALKRRIELQAMESNLSGLYEQRLRNEQAIADAWATHGDKLREALPNLSRIREIQGELSTITDTNSKRYQELNTELGNLIGSLDPTLMEFLQIQGQQDANNESIKRLEAEYGILAGFIDKARSSLQQWIMEDATMSTWFSGVTGGLQGFAAACEEVGLNTIQLSQMSDSALSILRENYDGTTESIIAALKLMGSEGEAILANLPENWRSSMSEATQALIDEVSDAKGLTLTQLRDLAMHFGIEGDNATNAFMQALRSGLDMNEAANLAKSLSDAFGSNLDPERAKAAIDAYMAAILDGATNAEAIKAAIDAIRDQFSNLDLKPAAEGKGSEFFAALTEDLQQGALDTETVWSDTGQRIGKVLPDGTVQGIEEGAPNIPPAVRNMLSGMDPVLQEAVLRAYESGSDTSGSYGQGFEDNSGSVSGSAANLIGLLMSALFGGVGQAEGVGADTGQGYGSAIEAQGHIAETAALNTLGKLLVIWLLGIESAKQAGTKTGTSFGEGLASTAQRAVAAAQAISIATGTAFGAGRSSAAAAGNALGQAFASAVWSSGGQAIAYARSIRNSVADIFSNIPTANIKVNVTRSISTRNIPATAAALPSQTPVMPVPVQGLTRAANVAQTAVQRVSRARSDATTQSLSGAVRAAVTAQTVHSGGAPVDYDAMYRVVKSGVRAAIEEAGGISPVIELDGRRVSRQLVNYLDSDFNRLREMRG